MIAKDTRVQLLGAPVNQMTMEEVVERCQYWIRENRAPRQVITVNAAILVLMRKDPGLKAAIQDADMVLCDGVPILWTSRILGRSLPERVAGIDLMERLLSQAGQNKQRVFFLGAREAVVRSVVDKFQRRYPDIRVAGYRNGYFSQDQWESVIRTIRESHADVLMVGMPTPFKEVWCYQHLEVLGASVVLGVGGSFDVLGGVVRRAPQWMQAGGLEWAWRLAMEPRRLWKRYLVTNTKFILLVLQEMFRSASPFGTSSG